MFVTLTQQAYHVNERAMPRVTSGPTKVKALIDLKPKINYLKKKVNYKNKRFNSVICGKSAICVGLVMLGIR